MGKAALETVHNKNVKTCCIVGAIGWVTGLLSLASLFPNGRLCAQGTVTFANNAVGPVTNSLTGNRVPAGTTFKVALYSLPAAEFGGQPPSPIDFDLSDQTMILDPSIGFVGPGLFSGGTRTNNAIGPGGWAWFLVRCWETAFGATFAEAASNSNSIGGRRALIGTSSIIFVDTGDPTLMPPGTPAPLTSAGLNDIVLASTNDFPSIEQHPVSQTTAVGNSVSFSVYALRNTFCPNPPPDMGAHPCTTTDGIFYQWRFNGANIPGATGPTYTIGSATPQSAGTYHVLVATPVQIKGGGNAVVASTPAILRIVPSVRIQDATVAEGSSGASPADFPVTLSETSTQTVTVAYSTSDATGIAGIDYQATNGILTFLPGEASKTISVQVLGNSYCEGNRSFAVDLANANNAIIAQGRGLGTIVDDDTGCLTLTINIIGSGSVSRNPNQPNYSSGSSVALRAIPGPGWVFTGWSGNASGTSNPLSLVMTANKSLTANFAATASACALKPSGLVSWWPGAGNGKDIQGTYNGTLRNGATSGPGKVGQGFSLDGVDDFFLVPHATALDPGGSSFTIEAWIQTTQATGYQIVAAKYECGGACVNCPSSAYELYLDAGRAVGALRSGTVGCEGTFQILEGTRQLADGLFHHVVVQRDQGAGQMRLYVDGTLEANVVLTAAGAGWIGDEDGEPDPLLIGAIYNGGTSVPALFFRGIIDELSFYNRALTAFEILAIYTAGSDGKCLIPLYITSIDRMGSNVTLSWLAQPEIAYRVQYKTNLNAATPWQDVAGGITATNMTASKTDVVPANATQRFYRVEMFR